MATPAPKFDKGSPVMLEFEFKKQAPFGTADYFDPTNPKVTITDPTGAAKVTDAALIKSAVGKYYYICQTDTNWGTGLYQAKATCSDGGYTDITVEPDIFELK